MGNHPKRSLGRKWPKPKEITDIRTAAGFTQAECAVLVHTTVRVWQQWEAGDRRMHPAFFELFKLKAASLAEDV